MSEWQESERYQALVQAYKDGNHAWQNEITERAVRETEGAEKAFWLTVRAGRRLRLLAPVMDACWADLQAALDLAPDHPVIRRTVLTVALALSLYTEDLQKVRPFVLRLWSDLRRLYQENALQINLGYLYTRRGRWRAAHKAFTQGIAWMEALPPAQRAASLGGLVGLYARRTVTAIACGQPEGAAGDLERALELERQISPSSMNPAVMGLARAEMAFHERRMQDARAALQVAILQESTGKHLKVWPDLKVEMELLAARMARAERSQAGFDHFSQRALAIALQHRLRWSEARVRTVMAGAER